ncbi:NADPH-dependent F420 reductase [Nonomuraea ferruginea]
MTQVSIIGPGAMGSAIADLVRRSGNSVELLGRDDTGKPVTGDIVVLAVPYGGVAGVIAQREGQFDGKVVVDITNPVDFSTMDSLTVAADGSATAEIAEALPRSQVVKAFNTNFAATLSQGSVGEQPTTVLIAERRRRRQGRARPDRHRRWPARRRHRLAEPGPRAGGPRLPADRPRGRREDRLDRRIRRRRLTAAPRPRAG